MNIYKDEKGIIITKDRELELLAFPNGDFVITAVDEDYKRINFFISPEEMKEFKDWIIENC